MTVREALTRSREGLAEAGRLWRTFMGDDAYERYLARHAVRHPDHPPMTKREFWRDKADFEQRNVQGRCC